MHSPWIDTQVFILQQIPDLYVPRAKYAYFRLKKGLTYVYVPRTTLKPHNPIHVALAILFLIQDLEKI